jgi:hypothetical protein
MSKTESKFKGTFRAPPPLPLVPLTFDKKEREKSVSFKLHSIPTDKDSPKIECQIQKINGSETLREGIKFFQDLEYVKTGCNLTEAEGIHKIAAQLLMGPARTTYIAAVDKAFTKLHENLRNDAVVEYIREYKAKNGGASPTKSVLLTVRNQVPKPDVNDTVVMAGKHAVLTYMAPTKALSKQQIWMRRHCRKPKEMSTKAFYSHLIRINDEELIHIPPSFDKSQRLKDDDLIDIILNSIPKRWLVEFERISFDPTDKHIDELLQQCERMESIDTMTTDPDTKTVEGKNSTKNKSTKKVKTHHAKKTGDCVIHGVGCGHSTEECKIIIGAKAKKGNYSSGTTGTSSTKTSSDSGSRKSKTWTKKSDDAKTTTKKEMMAFVEVVKEEFRKELNAFKNKGHSKGKKNKPSKRKQEESDDESYASAKSVNQFDSNEFIFDDDDDLAEGTERMTIVDKTNKATKDDESVYTVTSKKDDDTTSSTK